MKASIETFLWAVCLGAGFHIGYGLIALIVWVLARSLGHDVPVLK